MIGVPFTKLRLRPWVFWSLVGMVAALIIAGVAYAAYRWYRHNQDEVALLISVPSFEGDSIDAANTCDGLGQSPEIVINGLPEGSKSLALYLEDVTKPAVHWLMWDIPVTQKEIQAGVRPDGATARSYDGNFRYAALCPPAGERHEYRLHIFAVGLGTLGMSSGKPASEALDTVRQQSLAERVITGSYSRP